MNEPVFGQSLYGGQGYIRFCYKGGDETNIVEAARMSTAKGFLGWEPGDCPICGGDGFYLQCTCYACEGKGKHPGDERLLAYLHNHRHSTPFEFCTMAVEIKAPIFVARQVFRHRTFSFNEMSGRYVPMPTDYHTPLPGKVRVQGSSNRQSSVQCTDQATVERFLALYAKTCDAAFAAYQEALAMGIAKEQARTLLPLATMTRWRMMGNLRNWLHLLGLRIAPDAQDESQELAQGLSRIMLVHYPKTMSLVFPSLNPV